MWGVGEHQGLRIHIHPMPKGDPLRPQISWDLSWGAKCLPGTAGGLEAEAAGALQLARHPRVQPEAEERAASAGGGRAPSHPQLQ